MKNKIEGIICTSAEQGQRIKEYFDSSESSEFFFNEIGKVYFALQGTVHIYPVNLFIKDNGEDALIELPTNKLPLTLEDLEDYKGVLCEVSDDEDFSESWEGYVTCLDNSRDYPYYTFGNQYKYARPLQPKPETLEEKVESLEKRIIELENR